MLVPYYGNGKTIKMSTVEQPEINFHSENQFELEDESRQKRKILTFFEKEKCRGGSIQYIFMSDEQLYEMNMEYLNHDTYTDILTFDMSEGDEIAGDMYISIDRVKDNAKEMGVPWQEELDRVMVHGLLHLLGYNDKTEEEKRIMREKEDEYLLVFASLS